MWPFSKKQPAKSRKLLTRADILAAEKELEEDRKMIRESSVLSMQEKLSAGQRAEAVFQSVLNEYFQQRIRDSS